MITVRKYFKRK